MKKIVLLGCLFAGLMLVFVNDANAQLKVVANGDIGIGDATSPARQLHVAGANAVFRLDRKGSSAPGFLLSNQTTAGASEKNFFFGVPSSGVNNGYFYIGDYGTAISGASTRRLVVDNSGDVIIGTTTSLTTGYRLHVEGAAFKTDGGASWNSLSDRRLKTNISNYEEGLNMILQMQPKEYEYNGKAGTKKGQQQIGIIAQELKEIAPFMVNEITFETDNGLEDPDNQLSKSARGSQTQNYLTVNPDAIKWMLVNAIKEQQTELDEKENRISELEDRLIALETKLNGSIGSVEIDDQVQTVTLRSVDAASLEQNRPNPFVGSTKIDYVIPTEFTSASISIYGIQGNMIKSVIIDHSGEGSLNVDAFDLSAGTYSYRLTVDNQVVDTRKMILAN